MRRSLPERTPLVSDRLTTATVMAKYFAQAKIPYIFGYPGDPNIELMEQCRREGLEFILTCREGTAVSPRCVIIK